MSNLRLNLPPSTDPDDIRRWACALPRSGRIGHNTCAWIQGDALHVRYYRTVIFTHNLRSGVTTLYTNDFRTPTTKTRLNLLGRVFGFSVHQSNYVWYLTDRAGKRRFFEGITTTNPVYPWYDRLPLLKDADILQAVREVHGPGDYRLAALDSGAFRYVDHVLTADGADTGLVLKRSLGSDGENRSNLMESTIWNYVHTSAPHLLSHFPRLHAAAPGGEWGLHEKVEVGRCGQEGVSDLIDALLSAGIDPSDLHPRNIGLRESTRTTVFLDYGNFYLLPQNSRVESD